MPSMDWLSTVMSSAAGIGFLYFILNFVSYLFTSINENRIALNGEVVIDTLKSSSLKVKQTATLTNMKLYQNGVFLFGARKRIVVVPLESVDSVQITSGRNYLWLAVSIPALFYALNSNSSSSGPSSSSGSLGSVDPTWYYLTAFICFLAFWVSGSRQITVRSKTATISLDIAAVDITNMGISRINDDRLFAFTNLLQNLIMQPRSVNQQNVGSVPNSGYAPAKPASAPGFTSVPSHFSGMTPSTPPAKQTNWGFVGGGGIVGLLSLVVSQVNVALAALVLIAGIILAVVGFVKGKQ